MYIHTIQKMHNEHTNTSFEYRGMNCLCHSSHKTIRAFIKWSVDINLYKFKLIICQNQSRQDHTKRYQTSPNIHKVYGDCETVFRLTFGIKFSFNLESHNVL